MRQRRVVAENIVPGPSESFSFTGSLNSMLTTLTIASIIELAIPRI